ncbi:hypothetical protein B0T24DRAFT_404818 [Lasiosphaeria ovina]|uniref:Uncharacterized protein n=1 Tax=Lasiosphaeria ovina TaxID=92902 RepID=A0AAE0JWU1_9PEZI|nr:hypothetical protein B0T24DRAFT_404818 [Lasiosphaeria ovina]
MRRPSMIPTGEIPKQAFGRRRGSVKEGKAKEERVEEKSEEGLNYRSKLRNLPFTGQTFERIAKYFAIHGWVSRIVSRADVPTFDRTATEMPFLGGGEETTNVQPVIVYNCRTSNAWPADLALTVTHFPREKVSFAILFGGSEEVERDVIARLTRAGEDAAHPMLLFGLIAELERARIMELAEVMIDNLEDQISKLDAQPAAAGMQTDDVLRRSEKREAWLNTTFMRNALVSWNAQLVKMVNHIPEFPVMVDQILCRQTAHLGRSDVFHELRLPLDTLVSDNDPSNNDLDTNAAEMRKLQEGRLEEEKNMDKEIRYRDQIREAGMRIKDRLLAIHEEYEDKTRDCTMRVDGMAMATQWSHGETNVAIATATSQDSSQMRSIAIVTMVFLPGTFFASVFSMTFFNWSPDPNQPVVSGEIWIYVLITAVVTIATLILFWYFILHRSKNKPRKLGDEAV